MRLCVSSLITWTPTVYDRRKKGPKGSWPDDDWRSKHNDFLVYFDHRDDKQKYIVHTFDGSPFKVTTVNGRRNHMSESVCHRKMLSHQSIRCWCIMPYRTVNHCPPRSLYSIENKSFIDQSTLYAAILGYSMTMTAECIRTTAGNSCRIETICPDDGAMIKHCV